ncbi:hypothetical protein LWI28_020581 [Acer negundo]|uniref:Uncharacterized protein n=1 Tax=Acer negundo TaxID=4023 RepID=A0AAD5IQV7_ACENE|nr:hypothetical protein LWI28_020581 [Acer negundo]
MGLVQLKLKVYVDRFEVEMDWAQAHYNLWIENWRFPNLTFFSPHTLSKSFPSSRRPCRRWSSKVLWIELFPTSEDFDANREVGTK